MANHEPSAASDMPQIGQTNVRLEVQDFGPVAKASIQLRPLTVFVGPSNTGKTYLALLIYALHRAFEGFPPLPPPSTLLRLIGDELSRGYQEEAKASKEIEAEITEEMINKLAGNEQIRFSEFPELYKHLKSRINSPDLFGDNLLSELQRCFDIDSTAELIRHSRERNAKISVNINDMTKELWRFSMEWSDKKSLASSHVEDMLFPPTDQDSVIQAHTRKLCNMLLQETLENLALSKERG